MPAAPRAVFRFLLVFAILAVLAACGAASATPGQRLWTIPANEDTSNGSPSALYDPYADVVISLTDSPPSQDAEPDSSAAVTAVNPGTGHQVWSIVTGQAPQLAMAMKGLVVVATLGPAKSAISPAGGPPSVWVLDDKTGAEVRTIDMTAQAAAIGLTRGIIVANDSDTLYGYSPLTGANTWRWHPPHGCSRIESAAASAVITGVVSDCANGNIILTSVNPVTGTALWSRTVGYRDDQPLLNQEGSDGSSYVLSAQGSFFAVTATGGSTSNFSAAGKPLGSEPGGD